MNALTMLRPGRDALHYNDSALSGDPDSAEVALSSPTPKQLVRKLAAHCATFKGPDARKAIIQIVNTCIPFVALPPVLSCVANACGP